MPPSPVTEEPRSGAERALMAEVLAHLEALAWPTKTPHRDGSRGNVVAGSKTPTIHAFTLGKVRQYDRPGELVESTPSRKARFQGLYGALRALVRAHNPHFRYNAIQLNKNVRTQPHFDKNNRGLSYCLGLGHYKGGGLTVYPEEGQPKTYRNRNKWVLYDGAGLKHGSAAVQSGTRYAIVFYGRPDGHRPPQRRPPQHRPPRADAAPMTGAAAHVTLRVAPLVALDDDALRGAYVAFMERGKAVALANGGRVVEVIDVAGVSYVQACRRLPLLIELLRQGQDKYSHACRTVVENTPRAIGSLMAAVWAAVPALAARDVAFLEGGYDPSAPA